MDVEARIKRVGTPRPVQTVTPEAAESPFTANGEWVNFQPGTYRSIDFRGKYDPFNCHGAEFEGCRFSKVRMRTGGIGTGRIPSVFRDCEFVRSDLRGSRVYFARFERCLFDRTRIDGWWAFTAEFVDCRFVGPITDVRFAGSTRFSTVDYGRAWNEFHGNDFTDAELTRVESSSGSTSTRTRCQPATSTFASTAFTNASRGLGLRSRGGRTTRRGNECCWRCGSTRKADTHHRRRCSSARTTFCRATRPYALDSFLSYWRRS